MAEETRDRPDGQDQEVQTAAPPDQTAPSLEEQLEDEKKKSAE